MWPRVEPFACGQVRCAALIRMFWPETAWTVTAIGGMAGCSYTQAWRVAQRMGLGQRPNATKRRWFSDADVRKAYMRRDMNVHQAAASIGMSTKQLQRRAKRMGLPRRKNGPLKDVIGWPSDFDDLWLIGLRGKEIERACKVKPTRDSSVSHHAKLRGLPRRGLGYRPSSMTLEQARAAIAEQKLAQLMAQTARAERAAWESQYGRGSHAA